MGDLAIEKLNQKKISEDKSVVLVKAPLCPDYSFDFKVVIIEKDENDKKDVRTICASYKKEYAEMFFNSYIKKVNDEKVILSNEEINGEKISDIIERRVNEEVEKRIRKEKDNIAELKDNLQKERTELLKFKQKLKEKFEDIYETLKNEI